MDLEQKIYIDNQYVKKATCFLSETSGSVETRWVFDEIVVSKSREIKGHV